MEINDEKLVKFICEEIKHHKNAIENNAFDDFYGMAYHKGVINICEKIIKEFNLQRLF